MLTLTAQPQAPAILRGASRIPLPERGEPKTHMFCGMNVVEEIVDAERGEM
jgi:hypothetical protein